MTVDKITGRLEQVKRAGEGWIARCPSHEDRRASLSIKEGDDGRTLLHCFAGCSAEEVVAAIGLELHDLFHGSEGGGSSIPPATRTTGQPSPSRGCTLAQYAAAKALPLSFLETLGVSEIIFQGHPAVRFPYLSAGGEELCVRFRVSLDGDLRVRTKSGNKHVLYGLNRLEQAREAGYLLLVEGESDSQTLWHAGYPALGLPGASGWNEARDAALLDGISTIYVFVEPDKGGEAVLKWVGTSAIRDRVKLVQLDAAKDVSALWLEPEPDQFPERLESALQSATPWAEHERIAVVIRSRAAWTSCSDLAQQPRILERFADDLARTGLSGERRAGQLLYLILTSRLLPKPVSAAVKGPSAGGKSFLVATVSSFFPESAVYSLTAMSEHALAYGDEPLTHRVLVIYEAAGIQDGFAAYIIRSLLSEGRVRYETVERTADGLRPRLIEREGPTGLLTTTTAVSLHPENETRMLSIPITDTPAQTREVFRALALDEHDPPNNSCWLALQEWLAGEDKQVTVPYARALAELVAPVAVRLRRDFSAILHLIQALALLHQASRDRDSQGRIVATLDDYMTIRELVDDLVSEGIEATVPPIVRQTVQVVTAGGKAEGMSLAHLARQLGIDKSAASRRWRSARARGYLTNLETSRGKPARIVLADPLPDDVQILPGVEELSDRCSVDRVSAGEASPPPPATAQAKNIASTRRQPSLVPGDAGYPLWITRVHGIGQVTERELESLLRRHRRLWGPRVAEA